MKFTRTNLIERVNTEIDRRVQAAVDRNHKATSAHNAKRQEYLDRTGPAWTQLADTIRRRTRNKQPIVADDIPIALRDGWRSGQICTWADASPAEYIADVDTLTALLRLLESVTDDEINTASLERMGFRMADLFRSR